MGDLISRQEVLDEINRIGNGAFTEYAYYSNLFDFVCDLPSVEPERIQGKWVENKWGEETCSECGYTHKAEGSNFCPNCGAKMGVN